MSVWPWNVMHKEDCMTMDIKATQQHVSMSRATQKIYSLTLWDLRLRIQLCSSNMQSPSLESIKKQARKAHEGKEWGNWEISVEVLGMNVCAHGWGVVLKLHDKVTKSHAWSFRGALWSWGLGTWWGSWGHAAGRKALVICNEAKWGLEWSAETEIIIIWSKYRVGWYFRCGKPASVSIYIACHSFTTKLLHNPCVWTNNYAEWYYQESLVTSSTSVIAGSHQ